MSRLDPLEGYQVARRKHAYRFPGVLAVGRRELLDDETACRAIKVARHERFWTASGSATVAGEVMDAGTISISRYTSYPAGCSSGEQQHESVARTHHGHRFFTFLDGSVYIESDAVP